MTDQTRAYAACEALARSHYENFPVASLLLPAAMRPHIAAVYAFARVADDIADEGTERPETRRARLAEWQQLLHAAAALDGTAAASHDTTPQGGPIPPAQNGRETLIIAAAAHTIRSLDLPIALFDDLISAFCQDTTTTRYRSWADLFDYCRRSANPVGRLVLRIAGYRDARLDRLSDALCTALQLTNFWQDFGRDWRAGRLYVPGEAQAATGVADGDVPAAPLSAAWTAALAQCVEVTADQFARGRGVCDAVHGRLGYELRATWLGGTRILAKVDRARRDLFDYRPALGAADVPGILWRALTWKSAM
jgi:squalene synthase HpnC